MAAHHTLHQAFVRKAADAGLVAVAHTGDMHQGQIARFSCLEEPPFERLVDRLGVLEAAARCHQVDGVAALDKSDSVLDGAELVHGPILSGLWM